MEIKCNTAASVAEGLQAASYGLAVWQLPRWCLSSAPRACTAVSAHGTAWGGAALPSAGAPSERCRLHGARWELPVVLREIWLGCTHLDSNTAQPSPGPQASAVSLYHVAPKPWWKPALLRSVAKFPVTLMRPRFQPGKLLSSAILTAIARSAKRWKTLCDFPLHVPSSPAN